MFEDYLKGVQYDTKVSIGDLVRIIKIKHSLSFTNRDEDEAIGIVIGWLMSLEEKNES